MPRLSWLVAVGTALILGGLGGIVQAGPWTTSHHCPPSTYNRLNYWVPEIWCSKAQLQKNPPFLYAIDRHPDVLIGFQFQRFPCPATYPHTLYSFPQLDRPPVARPAAPDAK